MQIAPPTRGRMFRSVSGKVTSPYGQRVARATRDLLLANSNCSASKGVQPIGPARKVFKGVDIVIWVNTGKASDTAN